MLTAKVIERKPTKTGKVYFSLQVTTKPASADGKTPAEIKNASATLEMAQVQMAQLLGSTIPTVGSTVVVAFSVNPTTGMLSDEWCEFTNL